MWVCKWSLPSGSGSSYSGSRSPLGGRARAIWIVGLAAHIRVSFVFPVRFSSATRVLSCVFRWYAEMVSGVFSSRGMSILELP